MVTAVAAVIIFLLLVTIHELGHFVAAKASGVKVLEFAVGMGPAIFKKQGKNTLYSVRVLPIGGFCKMEGEDEDSEDEGAFGNQAAWKRLIILAAGAVMNLILGFVICCIFLMSFTSVSVPVISEIVPDFPAAQAGLSVGDEIVSVNGQRVHRVSDISFELSRTEGKPVDLVYKHGNEKIKAILTPVKDKDGIYRLGFKGSEQQLTAASRIKYAYYEFVFLGRMVYTSLFDLVKGKTSPKDMSGPVGIVSVIGSATQQGMPSLLWLTALITINLGIFNLLPLPALDGGRIIFVLVEAVRRRKIPADKEGLVHFIGFVLLILLMLFATSNDVMRLFAG